MRLSDRIAITAAFFTVTHWLDVIALASICLNQIRGDWYLQAILLRNAREIRRVQVLHSHLILILMVITDIVVMINIPIRNRANQGRLIASGAPGAPGAAST